MKSFRTLFITTLFLTFYSTIYSQGVSGVYSSDFNKLTITQNGNQVTGTYEHAGGRIEGVINGNTVTGWWYQTNGKGKFIFNFNSDFSSFTGKWGYNDSDPTAKWNGTRIGNVVKAEKSQVLREEPAVLNVAGVYNTDFNEMTLTQSGKTVTGTYKHSNGRVEGTLNGNVLTGRWYQDNGKGKMEFIFSEGATSFTGKWGYNEDAPTGRWNGQRK